MINSAGELVLSGTFLWKDLNNISPYADRDLSALKFVTFALAGYRTADGMGLWAESYGGAHGELNNDLVAMSASPAGNVILAGYFKEAGSIHGLTLPATTTADFFVLSTEP